MHTSRRLTVVVTALVTAVTLGVAGAILLAIDAVPAPSIAPMASADTADGGGEYEDPWAAHEARCAPVMDHIWGPDEAELAEIREDNERMMAALDEAGVEYRLLTEENGWEHIEPADGDYEAFEQALEEFWGQEGDGPNEEHLADMREQNAALAAHLDKQGVEYEIISDPEGWEHVEPADDDGWQVMNDYWREQEREDLRLRAEERGLDVELALSCFDEERELSGMYDGFDPFPFPMDLRMASEQKAVIEDLMAAFDEAGIDYQRLDVPFIQWDRSDEDATAIIERIAEEHGWGFDMGETDAMMMEEEVIIEGESEEQG